MNGSFRSVTDKGIDFEGLIGGIFIFFSREHLAKLDGNEKIEGEKFGPKGRKEKSASSGF